MVMMYLYHLYMMIMCCVFLQNGKTALHYAAEEGYPDVADLLLKKKPDLIIQTDNVSKQIIQLLFKQYINALLSNSQ